MPLCTPCFSWCGRSCKPEVQNCLWPRPDAPADKNSLMKIAFDLRRIKNPGIGRYMKCLVEAAVAQSPDHEYLLILPPHGEDLVTVPVASAQKVSPALKYYSVREQIERR